MLPPNLFVTPKRVACFISQSAAIDKVLTSRFNRSPSRYATKLFLTTPHDPQSPKSNYSRSLGFSRRKYQPVLQISHPNSKHPSSRYQNSRLQASRIPARRVHSEIGYTVSWLTVSPNLLSSSLFRDAPFLCCTRIACVLKSLVVWFAVPSLRARSHSRNFVRHGYGDRTV